MTPALERLRQIAERATQGKWATDAGGDVVTAEPLPNEEHGQIVHEIASFLYVEKQNREHIATFSPQTVLALLDLVDLYQPWLGDDFYDKPEEAAILARLEGVGK